MMAKEMKNKERTNGPFENHCFSLSQSNTIKNLFFYQHDSSALFDKEVLRTEM